MELTTNTRIKHSEAVLRLIGLRHLNGERLKDLAREFRISYRTVLYHSVNTGFYLPNYKRLKQYDFVVFRSGTVVGLMERKILLGGRVQTVLIPMEKFLNDMPFEEV